VTDNATLSPSNGTINGMIWTGGTIAATTSIYGNINSSSGNKTVDGCEVDIYATISAANSNFKVLSRLSPLLPSQT
jgi:hypothetical protein